MDASDQSAVPALAAALPWHAGTREDALQELPPRVSVPELIAAASSWAASNGDDAGVGRTRPSQLRLHGQVTSRRKLAKDLIFFDMKDPGVAAAKMAASPATALPGAAGEPANQAVELVLSGREVDAATVELGRGLRLGDCIEVICAIEPSDRATRSGKGKPSPGVAVQAQLPNSVVEGEATKACIQVESRWADKHGRLDFATANLACFKASQRSRSKQGRRIPAPEGERVKRRPGAKQRKHSRHLELCRQVVERLDVPANAPRLAYTRGVCEGALGDGDSTTVRTQEHSMFLGSSAAEAHAEACGLKPQREHRQGDGMEASAEPVAPAGRIDWASMPASLDPARGEVGGGGIIGGGKEGAAERAERKRWQVESVYCALLSIVNALDSSQSIEEIGECDEARNAIGGSKVHRVVDFGSGSGNATLAIAWLLRDRCSFVLLDMKPVAVQLAETRVAAVPGLEKTVCAVAGRIEDYRDGFDIGVAVHACGMATDYAQLQCISRGAPYLLVPCCVGKINIDVSLAAGSRYAYPRPRPSLLSGTHPRGEDLNVGTEAERDERKQQSIASQLLSVEVSTEAGGMTAPSAPTAPDAGTTGGGNIKDGNSAGPVPRSAWLRAQLTSHEWSALVSVANHNGYDFSAEGDVAIRRCGKTILEADRNEAARESGYLAVLSKLVPLRASPMNDVLIGWPNTGNSATMLAQATPKSAATQLGMEDHNASGGSGKSSARHCLGTHGVKTKGQECEELFMDASHTLK